MTVTHLLRLTLSLSVVLSLCSLPAHARIKTSELLSYSVFIETDSGQGSGVIISGDGRIATALHVFDDAKTFSVTLENGDIYSQAILEAVDEDKDIAIIKVPGFQLSAAPIGNSDKVDEGDTAWAVGAPQGFAGTVTKGIVSSVRRSGEGYKLLQIDAPISAGSSGGGIFDRRGNLIGITVSSYSAGQNLNFAIPINYVRGLMQVRNDTDLTAYLKTNTGRKSPSNAASNPKTQRVINIFSDVTGRSFEGDKETGYFSEGVGDQNNLVIFDYDEFFFYGTLWTLGDQAEGNADFYHTLLRATQAASYAKIGLDDGHDLWIGAELPWDALTEDIAETVVDQVERLNEVSLNAYEESRRSDGGSDSTGSTNQNSSGRESRYAFLDGRFSIALDAGWSEGEYEDMEDGGEAVTFPRGDSGLFVKIIAESVPVNSLEGGRNVMEYLKNQLGDSIKGLTTVGLSTRTVNDTKFYLRSFEGNFEGFNARYDYAVYVGPRGIFQIIVFTTNELQHELSSDLRNQIMRTVRIQ